MQLLQKSAGHRGCNSVATMVLMATQIADALGYLHQRGVIHRDGMRSGLVWCGARAGAFVALRLVAVRCVKPSLHTSRTPVSEDVVAI
jgi:hypothetical protein